MIQDDFGIAGDAPEPVKECIGLLASGAIWLAVSVG